MKNMINACEAKAITKNAANASFTYDCFIE